MLVSGRVWFFFFSEEMSTIFTEIFALLNDFPAESSSLHQPLQADGTHKTHGWMERPGDDGSPWDETRLVYLPNLENP